jgi:hypothetical protein
MSLASQDNNNPGWLDEPAGAAAAPAAGAGAAAAAAWSSEPAPPAAAPAPTAAAPQESRGGGWGGDYGAQPQPAAAAPRPTSGLGMCCAALGSVCGCLQRFFDGLSPVHVQWFNRTTNMGLSFTMSLAGAYDFQHARSTGKFVVSQLLVALYVMLFALLLFVHECATICAWERIVVPMRRSVGFLFKPAGKASFLLFVACLSLGLEHSDSVGTVAGVLSFVLGGLQLVLAFCYPHLVKPEKEYGAMTDYSAAAVL